MKRLGKYSGRIYDEEYDTTKIKECCQIITDEQAEDKDWINERHLNHLKTCITCNGCPAAIEPDSRTIYREFNGIGEKITIQLRYEDLEVTRLPIDCSHCPVGFMRYNCGRKIPLTVGKRPDTCKLKLVNILEVQNDNTN